MSEEKVKHLQQAIDQLKYDIEQLKQKNKKLKAKKQYGLVWETEKEPEKVVVDCRTKLPILKETSNKIITNESDPANILIEGDNYHALSVLNYTHKEKIDIIYLDPPYNTGNGDFKYNDHFVDKEDEYRHSKWLAFMEKRLSIAKYLLRDTGIIFISIDDNEQAQLKLLCDEIFNEQNYVATLIWHSRQNVDSRSLTGVSTDHEYVLCYRRTDSAKVRGRVIDISKYTNPDNDSRGPWMSSPIDGLATKSRRPNLHYTIVNSETKLKYEPSPANGWRFQKSTIEHLIKEDRIIWPKNPKSKPRMKRYLNELKNEYTGFSSILEVGFTTQGTNELRSIMGGETLKFPKPVSLIKTIVEQCMNKNGVVLDFFAGSGTTGHAVLDLNREDGGKRKFILCTNNENNICTDVCYPRLEKVIRGYKNSDGNKIDGLGGNLRYFRTAFIDVDHVTRVSDEQRIKLTYQAGEMIALREDTFEEVEKNDWWQIFTSGKKHTAIYFKEDKTKLYRLIEKLSKHKEKVALYIFSWGKNEYKNEFAEYKNIKVLDIPEPIIEVYKGINRL